MTSKTTQSSLLFSFTTVSTNFACVLDGYAKKMYCVSKMDKMFKQTKDIISRYLTLIAKLKSL